jgi:hypothetical protein
MIKNKVLRAKVDSPDPLDGGAEYGFTSAGLPVAALPALERLSSGAKLVPQSQQRPCRDWYSAPQWGQTLIGGALDIIRHVPR